MGQCMACLLSRGSFGEGEELQGERNSGLILILS